MELTKRLKKIEAIATELGLDYFPINFEICPPEVVYTVGAYGIPIRFHHWSFGKNFQRMILRYDMNLERIYELVINSDPCHAFILENSSIAEQTMIAAHVFGHSDFFKNNIFLNRSGVKILDLVEIHKNRIKSYEEKYGKLTVEQLLDAALALKNNSYREHSLIEFISKNSKKLKDWQKDILDMLQSEMNYFLPLRDTKIINEGWATFWHSKIIRQLNLSAEEFIEYAQKQSNLLKMYKNSINPYLVGFKIFSYLEREIGIEGLFEVRRNENDVSLIQNHLTMDLIKDLELYLYAKRNGKWVIIEKEWGKVKDGLVEGLINGGYPIIKILDGDYKNKGELFLQHSYDGKELDIYYLKETLEHIYYLWGRGVYLETTLNSAKKIFFHDGKTVTEL